MNKKALQERLDELEKRFDKIAYTETDDMQIEARNIERLNAIQADIDRLKKELNEKEYEASTYKPRRAYELDLDTGKIVGRFYFIIAGQMNDGSNCWYKCDKNGDNIDYSAWYSFTRKAGHIIAILEGVN